jgi:2-dehydropantoate 2-reductase
MKVCVFGAGAIGGLLGAHLARAGVEASLVARGPHLAAMRAHGLRLRTDGDTSVVRLQCTDNPAELGEQDYVIVTLKAHSIPAAVDEIVPLLGPDTSIVTASNGIPYWYFYGNHGSFSGIRLASVDPGGRQWDLLGPARAIGCVALPSAEVTAPGVIRHEHGHTFPIGEPGGKRTDRIERLRDALEGGGLKAPIVEDIRDEIWLKLWGNQCFNPISALTLATIDIVIGDPGTRALCQAMMLEMKTIGDRLGLRLRVDAERRIAGAHELGPHKMSMLQDLERGRPMEIEPLVGVVQELGRITNVATPTIDVVLALIRQRARYASVAMAPHNDARRQIHPH